MKGPLALLAFLSWAACLGAAQGFDLTQILAAAPECAVSNSDSMTGHCFQY